MNDIAARLKSNIWKLYLLKGVRGLMLVMPTIVLFFQENGLSMTEVFILQTVFSVAIVAIEIPSGYFADTYGRKTALTIGAVCTFLSFFVYSFSYDFWVILLAEILMGIGFAFTSGADSALLYDSLQEIGESDTYRRREGRIQSLYTSSEALGSVIGGYLALVSLRTPFIAEAIVTFFLIPIALSLYEPVRHANAPERELWSMRRIVTHTLYGNATLRWLIVYYGILTAAGLIVVWFRQSYFQEAHIPLEYFGYLWATLMLAVSTANLLADWYERIMGRTIALASLLALGIAGFLLLGLSVSVWAISGMFLFCFMRGFADPIVKHHVQLYAHSDIRATVLSIKGFVGRAFFAIAGPLAGWASDIYSLQFALMATGALFGLFGCAALLMLWRNRLA